MKKTFQIGQSNEVIKNDRVYDLHNFYDFIGVHLIVKKRQLKILFDPNPEYGSDLSPIYLNFERVEYLEFNPNFGAKAISGLDEIGYKNPDDIDDKWLMNEQQADLNDHLFFRLEDDNFIRVYGQYADLVEVAKLITIGYD